MKNESVCLIGYGYWGKILEKNLLEIGFSNITLVDIDLDNLILINDIYDLYFISTPFSTHFEILKKICRYKNKKIWCEKPLVSNLQELSLVYEIATQSNSRLFVDWVYIYNPGVNYLKIFLSNKDVFQIILNRTNDGPSRNDCDSRWDLSSHDVSIILHIFGNINAKLNWNEFSVKSNESFGSNLSNVLFDKTQVIINSSWQQDHKNRTSIFITKDLQTLIMDDVNKKILCNGEIVFDFSNRSPLKESLKVFLGNDFDNFEYNKQLTVKITQILDDKI